MLKGSVNMLNVNDFVWEMKDCGAELKSCEWDWGLCLKFDYRDYIVVVTFEVDKLVAVGYYGNEDGRCELYKLYSSTNCEKVAEDITNILDEKVKIHREADKKWDEELVKHFGKWLMGEGE